MFFIYLDTALRCSVTSYSIHLAYPHISVVTIGDRRIEPTYSVNIDRVFLKNPLNFFSGTYSIKILIKYLNRIIQIKIKKTQVTKNNVLNPF